MQDGTPCRRIAPAENGEAAEQVGLDLREILRAMQAVRDGDFSVRLPSDEVGLAGKIADTFNEIVSSNQLLAQELDRIGQIVGKEGKTRHRISSGRHGGAWRAMEDSVNTLVQDLLWPTAQATRAIAAFAKGDLSQTMPLDVGGRPLEGEFLRAAQVVNAMIAQMSAFTSEVTRVAREVGTEGKLGGQAIAPGAAGTWKDLTDNVNQLAANLTIQVRAIARVATAVTKGDLTRSIHVDARGEVADLKDNINAMIGNLRATTERNTEQDWLKTNLAKFSRMMQGQHDLVTVGHLLLSELAPLVNAQQALAYVIEASDGSPCLKQLAAYADPDEGGPPRRFRLGEGLVGQCAVEKQRLMLTGIPPDSIRVRSGLVQAVPRSIIVLPVLYEGQVKAVIELASLHDFTASHLAFLEQLTGSIGVVVNTIEATMRTQGLLEQSQELAIELQTQQKELQQTNEELATKARLLAEQNAEVERKNQQIELARRALEDKATELALTSRYKSEFLANMSHELRTPLNSILILGQQLAENRDGNLCPRQVEFAKTIHAAGTDLLNLISDILDLSKIESGTVTVECGELAFPLLCEAIERNFRHEAESRGLTFSTSLDPHLGRALTTDSKRLMQVLKNLLSNAFKFTDHGGVRLHVGPATGGWGAEHPILTQAQTVVELSVSDTGIGIAPEKHKIIFEAFQQADAGTARKYGGTGLGLAISRELAHLLGGEIRLTSVPGRGSTFTLYLPLVYAGPAYSRSAPRRDPGESPAPAPFQPIVLPAARAEDAPDGCPAAKRRVIETLQESNEALHGRKVLVVDDDIRNIFALHSLLERHGMEVMSATNGHDAIELIESTAGLSLVLMDIMMPAMDGYETIRRIRENPDLRLLPIIALTARAMKADHEKCLEAGASDYVAKPVDTDQLLLLVRTWLHG